MEEILQIAVRNWIENELPPLGKMFISFIQTNNGKKLQTENAAGHYN